MSTTVIGALSVKITADASGVKVGMKATNDAIKKTKKKVRGLANAWGKYAVAATAAAGVAAAAIIKSSLSNVKELNFLAQAGNTTVAQFQRMAFAAEQYGIEQDKLGDILKDMNDRVGDFITTGGGPMIDFFEQIGPKVGVTIEDFKKLSGPESLQLYVSSLEKANLSQSEMVFFMEAMASDSTLLLPLLKDNGKAMAEQAQAAKDLGIGLSEINVKQALDAEQALAKVEKVLSNELLVATAEIAPFITALAGEFINAAKESGGFAGVAISGFRKLASGVGMFADGLHGIKILFKGLELGFTGFAMLAAKLVEGLIVVFASMGNAIVTGLVFPLKSVLELMATFSDTAQDALDGVNELVEGIKLTVPKAVSDMANAQVEAVQRVKGELHEMAMEEIPSEGIDKFLDEVEEKAAIVAEKIKASLTGDTTNAASTSGTGQEQGESKEAERIRLESEAILEALLEQGLMREETLFGRLEREQQILDAALANKQISEEEHSRASIALEEKAQRTKLNIVTSTLDATVKALAIGGKKAQKVIKAVAIVNAVIKGKEAAVSAWNAGMSVGGPWAPLVAAAYTAASLANTASMISSIKSAGSSQGGGRPSGSLPSVSTPSAASGETSQNRGSRSVSINILGEGLMSSDQVRGLIGQINDQTGDGVELITT